MAEATVPTVYAEALLQLAAERGTRLQAVEDCRALARALHEQPRLLRDLDDPRVGRARAKQVLETVFAGTLGRELLDLLKLLVDRGRLGAAGAIAAEAVRRAERAAGVVHVTATTAEPLVGEAETRLAAGLKRVLGPGAVLHTRVDPALIGGLALRVDDTLVDGSVRSQLLAMKNLILATPVSDRLWDGQPEGVPA